MKALKILSVVLSSIIIVIAVDQYFFCPVYTFEKAAPFSGDSIYNPYASAMPGNWLKCNFHAHTHCWNGLTNGKGSADDIHNAYSKLGYDIHAISNYQHIDTAHQYVPNYISCYEHGYNVLKTHQLVLGASTICWKDYLLPQTVHNKQDILVRLHNTSPDGLIVINHPMIRNGYRLSDFKYLTQYSCMEVLRPLNNASALWDECLSAGKPVFIIGSDDCHDVFDTTKVGSVCTWINIADMNSRSIIQALKTGSGYAMNMGKSLMQEVRRGNNDSIPVLQKFVVHSDTVSVKFNLPAKEITVSGQNGHILHTVSDTNTVIFKLGKDEPYARISATFKDSTALYLNPVFRYHQSPLWQSEVTINVIQTFLLRLTGIVVLATWFGFLLIYPFIKKFRNKTLPDYRKPYHK